MTDYRDWRMTQIRRWPLPAALAKRWGNYRYGIGHFIGMEVDDEGDSTQPLQAGMALTIVQGVFPPNGPHAAFEDDIIVTPTGHEWVSRSIPIEIAEIEALAKEPSNLALFFFRIFTAEAMRSFALVTGAGRS
jgi:hypothetical protein